ncbi:unnamed protein product [Caenorhabditis auriculariae]|uniref:Uncharacterized protein n=1 Tax=Caenorhabditis auriculariae TaxID=2777116 RepID=A0A8S1HB04_9PELO|nr:unnamed protein product [Caenorhabditis auriculariae]
MSIYTRKIHAQLLRALVLQASIPILLSFLPCIIVWYTPLLEIQAQIYTNSFAYPMLSAFPCCDPVAIILFIPDYRQAVLEWRQKLGTFSFKKNLINSAVALPVPTTTQFSST